VGAVDAQNGKPSSGKGTLECNKTYEKNIGISPMAADLGNISTDEIVAYVRGNCGDED
jgi:DNA (cytosine-5)-methyltransferase 1